MLNGQCSMVNCQWSMVIGKGLLVKNKGLWAKVNGTRPVASSTLQPQHFATYGPLLLGDRHWWQIAWNCRWQQMTELVWHDAIKWHFIGKQVKGHAASDCAPFTAFFPKHLRYGKNNKRHTYGLSLAQLLLFWEVSGLNKMHMEEFTLICAHRSFKNGFDWILRSIVARFSYSEFQAHPVELPLIKAESMDGRSKSWSRRRQRRQTCHILAAVRATSSENHAMWSASEATIAAHCNCQCTSRQAGFSSGGSKQHHVITYDTLSAHHTWTAQSPCHTLPLWHSGETPLAMFHVATVMSFLGERETLFVYKWIPRVPLCVCLKPSALEHENGIDWKLSVWRVGNSHQPICTLLSWLRKV